MVDEKIFEGFEVSGVTSMADLETVIFQMKQVVETHASEVYASLVKAAVERMVDEIALNVRPRPNDTSILDAAASETRSRVMYAEQRSQDTEFNLSIGIQVLVVPSGDSSKIILRVISPNDMYMKKLSRIRELVPLSILRSDLSGKGKKKKLWDSIIAKYEIDVPVVCNLLNYQQIRIDPMAFKYKSPKERAKVHAKEKVMNRLVSQYACDGEIPPFKIMEYVFASIERMRNDEIKHALEFEQDQLGKILPEITFDLVARFGPVQDPPVPENEEEKTVEEDASSACSEIEEEPEPAESGNEDGGRKDV